MGTWARVLGGVEGHIGQDGWAGQLGHSARWRGLLFLTVFLLFCFYLFIYFSFYCFHFSPILYIFYKNIKVVAKSVLLIIPLILKFKPLSKIF